MATGTAHGKAFLSANLVKRSSQQVQDIGADWLHQTAVPPTRRIPAEQIIAESFFASLKKEEFCRRNITFDRAFQVSVASYVEFYNTRGLHRALKNLMPCQIEEDFNKNDK